MKIQDIVSPESIVDDLRADTKEGVLRELSEVIAKFLPKLSTDSLTSILMERESLGSTGIGDGVAIPHGKVAGIERLVAAFGRSRNGVPRITSYNVCYTKLLRILLEGNPEEIASSPRVREIYLGEQFSL